MVVMEYYYDSPIGILKLVKDDTGLAEIEFVDVLTNRVGKNDRDGFLLIIQWLDQYFNGKVRPIDFPLHPIGTSFQKTVWQLLLNIPYGQTISYGELASLYGQTKGISFRCAQAIGQAVGANPLPIVIPCHRVLAKDNLIGGYSGGLARKRYLLDLERIQYKEK